jgi:hypothetical protein
MSLHWVSRTKRLDTQRGNQMNLITFQAAYHIEYRSRYPIIKRYPPEPEEFE